MKGWGRWVDENGQVDLPFNLLKHRADADRLGWNYRPPDRERPYMSWWRHFLPATWQFCGPYHFMLYHGDFWYWQPHPSWCAKGKMRRCGQNSIRLAMQRPDLTYVEGVAYTQSDGLVEHSWVVDQNRRIIDPTWGDEENLFPYFGVPFKTAYVRAVCEKGPRESIIHNWRECWPLLEGLPVRQWKGVLKAEPTAGGPGGRPNGR